MMENDPRVDKLWKECGFYYETAKAYVEFEGKCAYCGQDLIKDRLGYACGKIDHLLPQSIYSHYASDPRNRILACDICNSLKGNHDPCYEGEVPENMLANKRDVLIQRARDILKPKREKVDAVWEKATNIFQNYKPGKDLSKLID